MGQDLPLRSLISLVCLALVSWLLRLTASLDSRNSAGPASFDKCRHTIEAAHNLFVAGAPPPLPFKPPHLFLANSDLVLISASALVADGAEAKDNLYTQPLHQSSLLPHTLQSCRFFMDPQ